MLSSDHLTGVWDIICSYNDSYSKEEELIFDINKLPVETARALERFVKTKTTGQNKSRKKKKEPAA